MRPQKGKVVRSIRKTPNMAPSKGVVKEVSEVKKKKLIGKKLENQKKEIASKATKKSSPKSTQMGIAKSFGISPKSCKVSKQTAEAATSQSKVKDSDAVTDSSSLIVEKKKDLKIENIKTTTPERKKNKKDTESKRSSQTPNASESKISKVTKNLKTKITRKKVVHKHVVAKKVKNNTIKSSKKLKETKPTAKHSKIDENKDTGTEKQKSQDCTLVNTEVTKDTHKLSISKKSEESVDSKAKSRTNSPDKKTTPSKTSGVVSSPNTSDNKQSPKACKTKQESCDSHKKLSNAPKAASQKSAAKKSPNKDIDIINSASEDKSSSIASSTKITNISDSNKETKTIGLPLFSNMQSVSPSGRKKLIGKVKPIARVKGTVIEKVISDPAIRQNINIISPSNIPSLDDSKSKSTTLVSKAIEETKKIPGEKDGNKSLKTNEDVSPPRTGTLSNVVPTQDVPQNQIIKNKTVVVGKAKKEIVIKNIPKLKKTTVAKACVVKKTPKAAMIKNVKLAKNLLKVSEKIIIEDSASDSISSSDDITYSFPELAVQSVDDSSKNDEQDLKSKSAIKPKAFKNLPKKLLVKNKKCQGLSRSISQAHSKEKKSKCPIPDKDVKGDKVLLSEEKCLKVDDKLEDSSSNQHALGVSDKDLDEKTPSDISKVKDTSNQGDSAEILSTSNDNLSDSKNDADDEEERYSFPEIKKESGSVPIKKKKPSGTISSKSSKKIAPSPLVDDNKKRTKLIGFWMGPKKYREASLNALAKVQCMYENESRSHVELGLMRTIDRTPPKWKDMKKPTIKTEKHESESSSSSSSSESEYEKKIKVESSEDDSDPPVKRTLRQHPTGSGKYWEMKLSSSEESEAEHKRPQLEKKKVVKTKVVIKTEKPSEHPKSDTIKFEKSIAPKPKKPQILKKKRNRNEVVMDLRDMVVRKRMASLNATAILAASYEKRSPKSSKDESTSDSTCSEKEEKKAKKPKGQSSTDKGDNTALKKEFPSSPDVKTKTLIVNQEADVTITGVYSTHTAHTGFCTVSEMQYRISATHTQTSATAAGEKELPSGTPGSGPSYTPLGALSSMHPPGGVSGIPQQHLHPGPSMESRGPLVGSLGRRAGCSSAFSAPPHHHSESDRSGYYQPAGPLISAGPLHGGFKTDGGSGAGSAPPPQDPGYGRYQYPQPQQVMHYNPHSHSAYGPGPGYGPPAPPAPPPRLPSMPPPPPAPSCYRPPPPAHRSHPPQHQPHPPYRPPPSTDNQVSPAGTGAYAPQFCSPCYQHPHVPPRSAISYLDSAYQGCPCPMQSCPKNVHTGPATGNPPASSGPSQSSSSGGKRVSQETTGGGCCAVALNPSLGLVPPETLGPPSPARGSAGLDPPHPPRRARLGKAMARKSIAPEEPPGHTMLLMCHPTPPPPLTINTDPPPPKVETVKNDEDSGDDVIIIDSPSSKLAPIDLSSSEENNCTDSKSEKDCEIVRQEDDNTIIVDLSTDTKKELPDTSTIITQQTIETTPKVETKIEEPHVESSATKITSESLRKSSEIKSKAGSKRRCSNLDIDMEVEIDDSLGANGIGEHVKLQKRQKVMNSNSQLPKKNGAMASDKGVLKKNNRLLNNSTSNIKKNTTKVDKLKPTSKPMTLLESVKTDTKKIGTKRKSITSLIEEVPANKRKKLTTSLLKSADKKQSHNLSIDDITEEKSHKKSVLSVPKAKSVTLLDNLIMNNNLDRVIDRVARNIPSDSTESPAELNPASLFNVTTTSPSLSPKASRKVSMLKPKKCPQLSDEMAGLKSRPVLNINNNVVKKVSESDCGVIPLQNIERKLSTEKRGRTKSKSPAALNRSTEKKPVKITAKIKSQSESENIVKDIPLTTVKVESVIKGRKSTKGLSGKGHGKRKSKSCDSAELEEEDLALLRKPIGQPRWSNGWMWEGEPQLSKVYVNNEDTWIKARCWSAMRHSQAGDTVKRGDSVLLRAGARRSEAPFVARVSQLWEDPTDGEMMVSLLWYYRPEHTERGRQPEDCLDEVFASRHRDSNSVACIEDKCYVLTYNEYCRYRKQLRASEENIRCPPSIVPSMPQNEVTPSIATNDAKIPLNISPDLVLFCRRIYDFRLKKVLPPTRP